MAEGLTSFLSEAVEATLHEKIGETQGMMTGFAGIVTYLDGDGEQCYAVLLPANYTTSQVLGLVDLLRLDTYNDVNGQMNKRRGYTSD